MGEHWIVQICLTNRTIIPLARLCCASITLKVQHREVQEGYKTEKDQPL